MTPSGQRICLSMIVKNEAPVIRRCLDSVASLIDSWVVVDTGSTDGTQDIVRSSLSSIPGLLFQSEWRDFAFNRTESLKLAQARGDFVLFIDADDDLVVAPNFAFPDLTHDSYSIDIRYGQVVYQRPHLVRSALPWRWRGVLHEFLDCTEPFTSAHLPLTLRINHDGARSRDPSTYARDAALLERALTEEQDPFLRSRYTFYLAQSYRDCGSSREALAAYKMRATLGYWDEEVYYSLYQAGLLEFALEQANAALGTLKQAAALCPHRAEAQHAASRICRLLERFEDGYAIAQEALQIHKPAAGLFVEDWVYEYGLLDELSVNAYWTGRYAECLDSALKLLERDSLPSDQRARITRNARLAFDRINDRPTR